MTSLLIHEPQRVLVADDERIIADTLAMILSQNGFEVAVCYNGKTAVEKGRQFNPEIFLCDVIMPEMNGVEAAIQIRAVVPECRILLFSGQKGVIDSIREAHLSGHEFEFLLKPVHPSDLLDRIRSLK